MAEVLSYTTWNGELILLTGVKPTQLKPVSEREEVLDEYLKRVARGKLVVAIRFSFNVSVVELLEAVIDALRNKIAIVEAVYTDNSRVVFLVADQAVIDAKYYEKNVATICGREEVLEIASIRGKAGRFYVVVLNN